MRNNIYTKAYNSINNPQAALNIIESTGDINLINDIKIRILNYSQSLINNGEFERAKHYALSSNNQEIINAVNKNTNDKLVNIAKNNLYKKALNSINNPGVALDTIKRTNDKSYINEIKKRIYIQGKELVNLEYTQEAIDYVHATKDLDLINKINNIIYEKALEKINKNQTTEAFNMIKLTGNTQLMNRLRGQVIRKGN